MLLKKNQRETPDWLVLIPAVFITLTFHLLAVKGYGIFRDELYYLACSDHPAFGYVDHPPLSIWILKLIRILLGDSLIAIRLLPILASAAWVFLTGLLARELGGTKPAMLLASFAGMAVLGNLVIFNYYSMNFFDLVFWQILFLILIRWIKTEDPRYWIGFGITAGFGLLNKTSILFFGFGLLTGLLLTRHRKALKLKFLWIGTAIAAGLFLPYILWNAAHDWAFLEFVHHAKTYKMFRVSPIQFFMDQWLYNNPVNLLIWLPGLVYFLFAKSISRFRLFGWLFFSIWVLFTIQSAKDYYLAAAYPILFAGGSVAWASWFKNKSGSIIRSALIFFLFASTVFLSPAVLPVLSVEKTITHINRLGIQGNSGENHEMGVLSQHFADLHGWPEMVKLFADVHEKFAPEEKSDCLIYVRNYGEAGAIDLFGEQYGLPKATCPHNNYWIWGPPEWNGETAIIYGWGHDIEANIKDLNRRFESVEHAATFTHPYCMPYQNNRHVFICRRATFDLNMIWKEEKNYN
ncbi:glycosyltransferase family 39 protein [bacterium]|nr:glycosyltransferase family 39 protein [bacterium]